MKFVVRSCNNRKWYVKDFLVPRLIELGIPEEDIVLLNDNESIGNLKHFIFTLEYILFNLDSEKGVWILQDDVLPSSDFYDVARSIPEDKVCNGFVCKLCNPSKTSKIGYQRVKYYWMSFPAAYFPMKYIRGFLDWFYLKCLKEHKWGERVKANKYDDFLFWQFMKEWHGNDIIINIAPNIVQHIDYMLGGSIVNQQRGQVALAHYWNEEDLQKELESKIEVYRNGKTEKRN